MIGSFWGYYWKGIGKGKGKGRKGEGKTVIYFKRIF